MHCPAFWQCTRLCVRSAPFRKAKLGQPLDGVSEGTATEFGFAERGWTGAVARLCTRLVVAHYVVSIPLHTADCIIIARN
eukprot:COSAG06_NODE_9741_length_1829_cov_1.134104_1_plen_79_part_10